MLTFFYCFLEIVLKLSQLVIAPYLAVPMTPSLLQVQAYLCNLFFAFFDACAADSRHHAPALHASSSYGQRRDAGRSMPSHHRPCAALLLANAHRSCSSSALSSWAQFNASPCTLLCALCFPVAGAAQRQRQAATACSMCSWHPRRTHSYHSARWT